MPTYMEQTNEQNASVGEADFKTQLFTFVRLTCHERQKNPWGDLD